MKKNESLANRTGEVLLYGEWIARTNIKDLLNKIDYQMATSTIGDHNSIALLCFHINYYIGGILQVLQGGELEIRDKFSFDMPTVDTPDKWNQLVQSYIDNSETLVSAIRSMTEEELESSFVKPEYGSYERNIEGLIEHSYYHFGQISLLKKLLSGRMREKKEAN